jgi:threonine synthase
MPGSEFPWSLECSACGAARGADGLPGVCSCGQPYLVRYRAAPKPEARALLPERRWTMWRYKEWLPLAEREAPVTLGEGGTPLLAVPRVAATHGFRDLWV